MALSDHPLQDILQVTFVKFQFPSKINFRFLCSELIGMDVSSLGVL